jgi:hypothetical protein
MQEHAHTHVHTHTRTQTYTHTDTHTHTHTYTHMHTRTHLSGRAELEFVDGGEGANGREFHHGAGGYEGRVGTAGGYEARQEGRGGTLSQALEWRDDERPNGV